MALRDERPAGYRPRARKSAPGTWTGERILAALRDWFELFGETPLSYEWSPRAAELLGLPAARGGRWTRDYPRWPSTATVCRRFGTWAAAVHAAGLPPSRAIAPARGLAERVEAAQRLSAQGLGPAEIAALLEVSPRTARGYLTARPCRDCGAPVVTAERCRRCAARRGRRPAWTRAEVRRAVRAWAREHGRPPTSADWTPTADPARKGGREYPRWPSYVMVETLFGSWRAGVEAAGFRTSRREWSREGIVDALREFASAHRRAPTSAELEHDARLPSPATVRAHLGSMQGALDAAGLTVRRRRWERDRIVAAIDGYRRRHGRLPTPRDWDRATAAHPHATTVLRRFGSWSAAIAAASAEDGRG